MKQLTLTILFLALNFSFAFAVPDYVHHDQTELSPGCGPNYMSTTSPTSSDDVTIAFKVAYQFWANRARIYYTTDGSQPHGAYGTPVGTTQVLEATWNCIFSDNGNVDVWTATIPAQPAGTTVRYIVSAWEHSMGVEKFGNGNNRTNSNDATVFQYIVATPTPVTLSSFTVASKSNQAHLEWITESEINNDFFTIQRSTDSKHWTTIQQVKGNGTTNQRTTYQYVDKAPYNGLNYYRLHQQDYDGRFSLSPVVSVQFDSRRHLRLFPTKAADYIYLNLGQNDINADIRVLNSLGQEVLSTSIVSSINVQSFKQDWYIVQLIKPNEPPLVLGRFLKL